MKHSVFYKNAAWQYGLQIVKYLFPFILLPYLTRVLEPDGYAVYAYVLAFMGFAQVLVDFGFNLSGTKQIAAARSKEEVDGVVGAITQARLALCAAAGIVVVLISLVIPIMHDHFAYTMLAYVAVCGRSLAPDFLFQGFENMKPLTVRYLVSKSVSIVLTLAFVKSSADILWIPIFDIVASAIALAWSFLAAKRLFGCGMRLGAMKVIVKELKESGLYCVSNMSSTAFTSFTTLLIGIIVTDKAQISYWSLSMTAVTAVQALYTPITNSLYPRMVASKDFAFAKKLGLVALPPVLIGTVAFALLSEPLMAVLGGSSYLAGAYVLVWVSPVLFFSFYGMLFGWPVLGAAGKVSQLTASTVIAAVFSIASLLGLAFFGWATIISICVVRCLTEALMCALRVGYCWKFYRYRCGKRKIDEHAVN